MIELVTYRARVFSAPNLVRGHAAGGSGRANPREALDWRHFG
jgi:hypothetical protein